MILSKEKDFNVEISTLEIIISILNNMKGNIIKEIKDTTWEITKKKELGEPKIRLEIIEFYIMKM